MSEVQDLPHVGLNIRTIFLVSCHMWWFQGLRMLQMGTFLSAALVPSVVEVRDLHHEVGLDMRNIFMCIMSKWGGSGGSGCC